MPPSSAVSLSFITTRLFALAVFALALAAFLYFAPKVLRAMKAKLWLDFQKTERPGRSDARRRRCRRLCPRKLAPAFQPAECARRNNRLGGSLRQRPRPAHPGKSFRRTRRHERRAAQIDFVARKTGRPFAQTIDLVGSMVAHEPKFLSENLLIFRQREKDRVIFSFFRGRARRSSNKLWKTYANVTPRLLFRKRKSVRRPSPPPNELGTTQQRTLRY